jgi:signal transduction histidine kinase
MTRKFTILYVDDEESNLNIFRNTFRREYNVLTAHSGAIALDILNNELVDLILTDQRMPDMDGVSFLKHTLLKYPDLNRILITGFTDFDALKNAVNEAQIFQYIQKPWTEEHLKTVIDSALEIYRLRFENKELTKELLDKNSLLEIANKELIDFELLKTDFLQIISHEIRTPLNGVRGFTDLLKDEVKSNEASRLHLFIDILDKSVSRLEKFSFSALQITRFKSGKQNVHFEKFEIIKPIEMVITTFQNQLAERKLVINTEITNQTTITADIELFKICIKELIENAIDYSPNNGIISLKSYEQNAEWIVVEIIDQGEGFQDKILNNQFKFFVKSDRFIGKNIGFDLAFVKLIMDALNGKIEINNIPDGGACVRLYFKK